MSTGRSAVVSSESLISAVRGLCARSLASRRWAINSCNLISCLRTKQQMSLKACSRSSAAISMSACVSSSSQCVGSTEVLSCLSLSWSGSRPIHGGTLEVGSVAGLWILNAVQDRIFFVAYLVIGCMAMQNNSIYGKDLMHYSVGQV